MSFTTITRSSFVFLLWVVSMFAISNGVPHSKSWPPPPNAVSGKEYPQAMNCNDGASKCFGKKFLALVNAQCSSQRIPGAKAVSLTATPRNVKLFARSLGSFCFLPGLEKQLQWDWLSCYDPRFVGGDGVMFYFHGKRNEHFSLVSDSNPQINARFIGRRPQGRSRDNTWIQALGLMFDSHTFTLAANKVAQWDDQVDHFLFTYNGVTFSIPSGHLSTWAAPDDTLLVERTAMCNSVMVTLPSVLEISVNVVPVTKEDDRIHKYQIPSDDCFAHLEVQFKFFQLSDKVEGVLGQTYRPEFQSPVKRSVPMPVMGGEDKYKTSSLVSANCNYCIFKADHNALPGSTKALVLDPEMTLDCTGELGNVGGFFCRR